MAGSYLIPKSMCSEIPKPKLPVSEKLRCRSSYSLTFRPLSRISSALGPRTVTCTAIFSFLRMPKDRTVYRALPIDVVNLLLARLATSTGQQWEAYCRQEFDQTTAQAPSPLWSNDHQTRQQRCSGPACQFSTPSWGWSSCRCLPPS